MKDLFNDVEKVNDRDLFYQVSKNEKVATRFAESLSNKEIATLDDLLQALTPARRKFAAAVIEAYKRIQLSKEESVKMQSSEQVFHYLKPILGDLEHEEFWLLSLNQCGKVIERTRISSGGYDCTAVDVRIIIRVLINNRATQCIIAHNHPSGNPLASREDRLVTKKVKEAASLMNIRLCDHVIVTNNRYYSFADEGAI